MRTTRGLLLAPVIAFGAWGCGAVNPRAGMPDVARLVSERGAFIASWPAGPEEQKLVEDAVGEILSREVTVESAVRLALLNNRNLQALYRELGIVEAELVQAGLLPNPVVSANVRFGTGPSGTGAELGLVQEVVSALQIPLRKKVAKANLERAKAEVANAVLTLALDTKSIFYRLQGKLQMLDLRRSIATALGLSRDLAERQRAAGNISKLEVDTERASHEQALVEVALSEVEVLEEREELNVLLGLWGDRTQWSVASRLPELPSVEVPARGLESLAVSQRLDLLAARTDGVSEVAQLRLDRLYGLIPSASMGLDSEREVVEADWSVGPALEIPIPLFDQSQARIAGSASRLQASNERFAALAVDIRAQVRRSRAKLAGARQRVEYYERVVLPLQSRVVEESQRQYNAMQLGPFQLLQARRDEIEVGRRYVETLTEYWLARTDLERAVGGELLPDAPVPTAGAEVPRKGNPHRHHGG